MNELKIHKELKFFIFYRKISTDIEVSISEITDPKKDDMALMDNI